MAKCAGCSGGLVSVSHSDNNCIHLTGDGSSGTPLEATLQIDPASPAAITCGPDGLSVAGGGSGGGQVLYFTVGTPGPAGFGGVGATPPTLLAAADYVGDGIDDSVAVQAAIDASIALETASSVKVTVVILPGIFSINTPLQTKGIPLIGNGPVETTILYTATFLGAPANTRTIDATVTGSQFIHLENLQIQSVTGGAAAIKGQFLNMINCAVIGDGKGADAGIIDVGGISSPLVGGYGRFENNVVSGTSTPFPDPGLILRDPIFTDYIIQNNSFTTDVVFAGDNHNNAQILGNSFQSCDLVFNAVSLVRFKIRENKFTGGSILATLAGGSSFFWTVVDNIIEDGQINIDSLIISKFRGNTIQSTLFGTAMLISNGGEHIIEGNQIDFAKNSGIILTTANSCVVTGNRIRFYGAGTVNVDDGIRIVTSDDCTVQGNSLESTNGRYGIFVVSGNTNMVTNNRLNGSGMTASLNDTATATVVAAGNYL